MAKRKKKKARRRIVAALADLHSGHKLGLMDPETVLPSDDGPYTPSTTATQRYLWGLYQEYIGQVVELAAGDDIVLFHNGDLMHGDRYPEQLVSTRKADFVLIAARNLRPWMRVPNVKALRILLGTAAHNFGEGSAEILVAEMLAGQCPKLDVRAYYHGLVGVGGVEFDVSHHGPYPGSRKWLEGNSLRYYLRSLMMDELLDGREPPRVVLRAHYHRYLRETVRVEVRDRTYENDIVLLPSFCGLGGYAHQRARSVHKQTHGLVAFEIVGGRLVDIYPFKKTLDVRTKEVL